MKRVYKTLFFTFIFLFFIFIGNVNANTLNSVKMDIFVDNYGNANITEVWDYTVNSGTENYHPHKDIGNSKFTDFTVRDETKSYTTLDFWNSNASFDSKAYKCGINKTSNGVELCWGISSYGRHTYTINYTITNFVSELEDSQMIYWELIPSGSTKGSVYIKFHSNFDYDIKIPVWGYGNHGGTCYVYDGYIEMKSNGKLGSSEYMTILAKFPKGTFNTSNILNNDFNYYYEMAKKGATTSTTDFIVFLLIYILINIIVFYIVIHGKKKSNTFSFGTAGRKIPRNVPYFRDIPYNQDIFRAYYIGYQYKLIKNKTDLLGALVLKWLKEKLIEIDKTGHIIFVKSSECLKDYYERRIFKILNEASLDGHLKNDEFKKWCDKNGNQLFSYFDKILEREKFELIEEGLIIKKGKNFKAMPDLKQEAKKLAGLKRYLKEYTLIKDRKAIEISIFEDYLVYAQLMGIAKEFSNEFENLYPDIVEQSNFISYDNIVFINTYSNNIISTLNSYRTSNSSSIEVSRALDYHSGGGGFSSGGGRWWFFWWPAVEWVHVKSKLIKR